MDGKNATPHSFRKSFIEMALNNNEDFISIINATGHSTVEMVKYYDTRDTRDTRDTLKNNAVHGMAKLITHLGVILFTREGYSLGQLDQVRRDTMNTVIWIYLYLWDCQSSVGKIAIYSTNPKKLRP